VSTETYWISKTVVADWLLTDVAGAFVAGAVVTGTVTLPSGTTAAMTVVELADRYRATYDPTVAGLHAYRLVATGSADGAEEGTFVVRTSLLGAAPIELDPTTDIGLVRLLCTDLSETDPLFTDAQIQAFLDLEGDSVKLAAAQALDTIASNEALVSKAIRTMDLQTDGPAVAAELRARAKELRDQAAVDDGTDENGDSWGFDFVDYDPWAAYRVP
jgi:hypothetical protein